MDRPFAKSHFRNRFLLGSFVSLSGVQASACLFKSTVNRELRTACGWHTAKGVPAMTFGKRTAAEDTEYREKEMVMKLDTSPFE
jgi:hypothetical protein